MSFFEFPHTRTYDNDLGWLIKHCDTAEKAISALYTWKDEAQLSIDVINELISSIESGDFPENIANAIKDFIVKNFSDIVGEMTKMVFFGLTDAGHFVAYIPETWKDIVFKTTGYDIDIAHFTDYGHLVLLMEVEGWQ